MVSKIPSDRSTEVNCLCCGGCGHSLDVQWASGQGVAHKDVLLQTSLSCQLTPFPRVPQSKRPSESISANTQGGEAWQMFRFILGSQTWAAKQLLEMKVNVCVFNKWQFFKDTYHQFSWSSFTSPICVCCLYVQTSDVFHGSGPLTTGPLITSWLSLSRSH